MNSAKSEEILWINTLKGACILLVVLYHVVLPGFQGTLKYLSAGFIPADMWVTFNTVLSPLRMPAFFFVSGLLAANGIINRPWKKVFTSRITNLFYLYILWSFIQWIFIYGISTEITGQRISHNLNASYAGSLLEFIKLTFLAMTTSWYLYGLAIYFFIAKMFRQQPLILLVIAVALNYLAVEKVIPLWGPQSVTQYFVYFLLGAYWSSVMLKLSEWRRENILPWAALAVLAGIHVFFGLDKSLFLCVLTILCSVALCRFLNTRFNMSALNWVGKNTLQIYVIHRIFIEYFGMSAILFAQRHRLFSNHFFSLLWGSLFPPIMVVLCAVCSVGVWTLTNRGLGKALFVFPTLIGIKKKV